MNGILLIDKPQDWTSHDVIAKLRGLLGLRRIGHAGTLDPMATGLLTVFVGRATRAVEFAEADDKTYIAQIELGITTDTQDTTGTVLTRQPAEITTAQMEAVTAAFTGPQQQIPPMYSAIKVQGKRLYQLARKGVEVERKARNINIRQITVLGQVEGGFQLEITCSKGTYIRTLCHDMGQSLGCGGAMSALRRTRAGAFSIDDAVTLEQIEADTGDRSRYLRPVDTLFTQYPALTLVRRQEQALRNGQRPGVDSEPDGPRRVYSGESGEFLALGQIDSGVLSTTKSFFTPPEQRDK